MSTPLLQPRDGITYLPHQEDGIRWMVEREDDAACCGGVLADDMGLGKTFQTIGLLKNGHTHRTLIVCPPALMTGWADELQACNLRVCLLEAGVWVSKSAPTVRGRTDDAVQWVFLTTYTKMTRYTQRLDPFGRIILDEGHLIRNGVETARFRAAMAASEHASSRWILTATPIQNGHRDWENLCAFLRADTKTDNLMLRRTMGELRTGVRDNSGLTSLPLAPNYIQHALHIGAPDAVETRVFRALCDRLDDAQLNPHISGLIVLELYLRIQQFLVHPQLYVEAMRRRGWPRPDWTGTSTKWTSALTVIKDAIAESVPTIVFCQFQREMEMMEDAVMAAGGRPVRIRSGADVAVARAAATRGAPVIAIVQIVAGGAGLNLQFCQRIVFLSQHWNPAVVHQAVGRAVRIGQTAVVDVHVFHVVDDVLTNLDRRMLAMHQTKIEGAQTVCSSLYEGYIPVEAEASAFADATDD
jgi:SNF2 family DNA or RNA helicase